ncbi:MAG: GNAT family N-acetyltransferase [Brevefilum sp.]
MTAKIRELNLDEAIKGLHFLSSYAFTPTPPLPDFDQYAERIRNRKGAKYFGAYMGDQLQAISCATTPMTQNLRGKLVSMGGVANVATHPAARRKGYVRQMMSRIFTEFHQNQTATSCLYPFKETFYQRMGYATLPQTKRIRFDPKCLQSILKTNLNVTYELVSFYEGYENFRKFCQQIQKTIHGMALFSIPHKEAAKSHEAWLVFARKDGDIIGAMNYTLKDQIMNQTLLAYDFLFRDPEGKFALLNWIARHIDQVGEVILTVRPDHNGENYYTDIRPGYQGVFVPPMGRVVNLKALDGISCGEGKLTIQLSDLNCEWNNGIWQLSEKDGKLQIAQGKAADCKLSIQGLSALIYGVTDPNELSLRGWGNPDPGQQDVFRSLFPPAVPYLHAIY